MFYFQVDLKLEIQRMNQKLVRLEDHMSDVVSRMNHMQRSTSQPTSIRSSNEPLNAQLVGASGSRISRRETPVGAAAPTTPEGNLNLEEAKANLTKVSTSEEPRKPKRKEKGRSKSITPKTSPNEANTSPTDSMVRGMLEDEILEQEVQPSSPKPSEQSSQSTTQSPHGSETTESVSLPRTKSKEFL